jgi:hypothetical protein
MTGLTTSSYVQVCSQFFTKKKKKVMLYLLAGGEILLSAIHKLINSVWNKEELPDQWKESIIVPVHK